MPNKKYKIKKGAVVQKVQEGIIIFDAEESKLYTFNETGALIFMGIKSHKSEQQIVENLMKEYDITKPQAEKEVMAFIQSLEAHTIIESL